MRGGWGGSARGGGGGPVARAPAPLEWRRGPRRRAWGAARERVCECVRPGSRAAGRAGPCLPAGRPRRLQRRARAHSRSTAPHTPDVHTHTRREASRRSGRARARAAARWGRGGGAGGGETAGRGGRGGRGRAGEAGGRGRGPTSPGGGDGARPSPRHPRRGTSGALFLSARRRMSDCLVSPLCYVIPAQSYSTPEALVHRGLQSLLPRL